MKLGNKFVERVEVELDVNDEFASAVLDELSADEMAALFNEEKILSFDLESTWNDNMIECLNENGRKHIKKLYDLVCAWYEKNPEDAEAEGYTEW